MPAGCRAALSPPRGLIVQEWLEAQADPATLVQPFVNLRLGRLYKATYGQELKVQAIAERAEPYPAEVPPGVLFLTIGVDVQSGTVNPRLEASVLRCWARGGPPSTEAHEWSWEERRAAGAPGQGRATPRRARS